MSDTKPTTENQASAIVEVMSEIIRISPQPWHRSEVEKIVEGLRAAGYAIVPLEPTEAMLTVGCQQQERGLIAGSVLATKIWRAMVGAAR